METNTNTIDLPIGRSLLSLLEVGEDATIAPNTVAIYHGSLGTALVKIIGISHRDTSRYDCKVIARPAWMLPAPTLAARPYLRDLSEGARLDGAGRGSLTPLA